jgi:hypothetical protein
MRRCLLKGCEQRFHQRQSSQRYCSAECQKAVRKWSRWKAQQRYRATKSGKEKRTDQSRRYRERIKSRKPPEPEADNEAARVITPGHFFRPFLQSARLLRGIHTPAAKSTATLLLARLPDLAADHKPASLERRLTSITKAHQAAGLPTPASMQQAVGETMKGIRRTLGTAQPGKEPLLTADIGVAAATAQKFTPTISVVV